MTTPYILYIAIGSGVVALTSIILTIRLLQKVNTFTRGSNGASLEDTISKSIEVANSIALSQKEIKNILKNLNIRITQKTVTPAALRFNPFENGGTNQSFAIAFLDESGNGVVLSSLYTREKTSLFAKPIKEFTSDFELTEEEQSVITQAHKK